MTNHKISLVITSINPPNAALKELARGCLEHGIHMILIGDSKSPADFSLDGCSFYSLEDQKKLDFITARMSPERHYARKNIGYLLAMAEGAEIIIETDDDNLPLPDFWKGRHRMIDAQTIEQGGWVNIYRYFSDANIWPRGLPLDRVQSLLPERSVLPLRLMDCPIQQGLADDNPDVDAIYRLLLPLPIRFRQEPSVVVSKGSWCPFNSQNTTWFRDAFPAMYLPAFCSFRMTDIWRGFLAQRLAWENGWGLLFHSATVWQDRNVHNLMRDFEQEIPGYLHNAAIVENLADLILRPRKENLLDNLMICYEKMVAMNWIPKDELDLVRAWMKDVEQIKL